MRSTHTWYAKLHVDIAREMRYTMRAMEEGKTQPLRGAF